MTDYNLPITAYHSGDRVELHPSTDAWMSGDRYGEVTKVGRTVIYVKMDRSGLVRRMNAQYIGKVDS